ncbi:MAG: hypothetical protein CSB01_01675 [Bacteroidia bacterium]|nr:MAG: hypothetical protein CSB01_01675 [Bacteroidia bacterium]
MNNKNTYALLLIAVFFIYLSSCKTTNTAAIKQKKTNPPEDKTRNEEKTKTKIDFYRASRTKTHDLIHTKLKLRFDWDKKQVLGQAYLTLRPHFYPADSLCLDAKIFDLHQVNLIAEKTTKPVKYHYDNKILSIKFDKKYTKNEKIELEIKYTAKPYENQKTNKGFLADDHGLFFVTNALEGADNYRQIWTQGETESNSFWFPTIDSPNQRSTQEIFLTVDNKYKTLSNGKLVNTLLNSDTTRTDHWVMNKPHAPYLFMIAVGDFEIVKDYWRNIPINYYIEPEYKSIAKDIFGKTPQMMEFFSALFAYDYPWNKYSQVVVREFVTGAMENTSAAVFGDFVLMNKAEFVDKNYETIVAHELAHQWFGNLVTTESWSNLTLNEAFATYAEYLWKEHAYGMDDADAYFDNTKKIYLFEARKTPKKLIRFHYQHRDDMFDAHSYNKGAWVLHMLRNYVGDQAFFEAIRLYLHKNQYKTVEIHDLRIAFEELTGEDLNWFFNQWFLSSGHPILDVRFEMGKSKKTVKITVEQKQDLTKHPLFQLPVNIDFYLPSGTKRQKVRLSNKIDTFRFDFSDKILFINFDADKKLLYEKAEHKPLSWSRLQYKHTPLYADRMEALEALVEQIDDKESKKILLSALGDKNPTIRKFVIEHYDFKYPKFDSLFVRQMEKMSQKDSDSKVRAAAIQKLISAKARNLSSIVQQTAANDSSFLVKNAVAVAVSQLPENEQLEFAELFQNDTLFFPLTLGIFKTYGGKDKADFFEKNYPALKNELKWEILEAYSDYALRFDADLILRTSRFLEDKCMNENVWWLRGGALLALKKIADHYQKNINDKGKSSDENAEAKKNLDYIVEKIEYIKNKETNPKLLEWYK